MLGIYEKRYFESGEKFWFGRYQNLTNILHWHFECEIIRIAKGNAQIRIGDHFFEANENDSFFCSGEDLHYILSEPDSQVDILIIDKKIANEITNRYSLVFPKLPDSILVSDYFSQIKSEISHKKLFYREAVTNYVEGLVLEIFRTCKITARQEKSQFYKNLISKINEDYAFITFENAVAYSGYSRSHFSKVFKQISGMSFSNYLNIIKVENAISIMHSNIHISSTALSAKCGFSTVRNFNRVFKNVTGFSPRALPKDFIIDTGQKISRNGSFNPTNKSSKLI